MRWWFWIVLVIVAVLVFTGAAVVAQSRLAAAIAAAEGWGVPNSRSRRNHNPGNLTRDTTGRAIGTEGIFVVFASDADGWAALEAQVGLMFGGSSRYYRPNMTIAEVAVIYTATQQSEWAQNVAKNLGVPIGTRISDL